jgi:hypothetical protein
MRVKTFYIILIALITCHSAFAQNYGNEWINYGQQYFAIKVSEKGIYRIDYNTMLQAGVPLGSFDPRSFQVFAKGEEQAIFVKNESSGIFQPGDFIEFYGEKNTGWFDKGFYANPEKHPNSNYSLINDTLTYYITWNSRLNNKRFSQIIDNNFSGYTPATFFWFDARVDFTSNYYAGETNNYGVTQPEYVESEGWFDAPINLGNSRTHTIPTPNIFTPGPPAQVELAITGASNFRPLNPDHHLQIQFAGNVIDTLYKGYSFLRFKRNIAPNLLNPSGTPFVFSSINSLGSTTDRSAVAYISVRYPHTFSMRNLNRIAFELPVSSGDKTLINFNDFTAAPNDTVWVYNLTGNSRSRAYPNNNAYRAFVFDPGKIRHIYITSSANTIRVAKLTPVSTNPASFARFRDFSSAQYFNSNYLLITHESLMAEAEKFRTFRNSTGYRVLLVDVEELYHQFGYGIKKHPLALRNFARYTLETYDQKPEKLFLVGRTRSAADYRKNATVYASSLVPSMGHPPSDNLITSGLDGLGYAPALATGRLAAKTPDDVRLYYDKVVQHYNAQQTPQEWMKQVLHFGGGSNINEQRVLSGYLNQYRRIVQDTLIGAHVRTFLKSSTEPIQINQSDSLKRIINDGVAMMTFFGHAAGIGFDISIDYPSEYHNYGKYPFLIANSCFAGDLFGSARSSSEEFVLIEEKGMIGYLAATSSMGAFELNLYSNEFLRNISALNYGKSVGFAIRNAIRKIQSPNIYIKNACLLKTLHGDPAVVLFSPPMPDYRITTQDFFFTPKEVTTELDSFAVNVIVTNIGKAIRDSIFIDLERTFSDGSRQSYQKRVSATFYKDTITFRLPLDREKGIGLNNFTATIDALNQIKELNENNNTATSALFIKSSDIIPVYPHNYAVVAGPGLTLQASTGDPFLEEKKYIFQIADNPTFTNSTSQLISSRGGVVRWNPPLSMKDSTVYFWRVSIDSTYSGAFTWRTSTFQYIKGKTGWSQAHFDQFANNDYRYVSHNKSLQQWDFINSINSIQAQTGIYPYLVWTEQYIRKNGSPLEIFSCLADVGNGMVFAVFDPVSAQHWISPNQGNNLGQFENYVCRARPNNTFDYYSTTELWRARMEAFIDTIPEGHYVMVASHRNHNAENYPESLYKAFETLGSANIRSIPNNTPYLLFGRKGNSIGASNEVIGGGITSIIQLTDSITTNWNKGHILSEVIGPASSWQSLHWKQESMEKEAADSVWMNVIGIRSNGQKDTLIHDIPAHVTDITLADRGIDAHRYPYLQLQVNMKDDINRTPAQMKYWKVMYEGIPETAIDPSRHFVFEKDTVQEGMKLVFSTAIHNISDYDMDSLLVKYWVVDQNRQVHPLDYPRQRTHPAGDVFIDTIQIPTRGLVGNNMLWMEVNPDNDQLEKSHFNNIGQIPFYVIRDKSNPVLEVTFDGVQIMDGDIVSAQPYILMTLRDDNPFLELNDTTLVKVFLTTPMNPEAQRIYFRTAGKENMRFFPATLPDNTCLIEFNPMFEVDGNYTIRVQATDMSMNESGKNDYVINFQIATKPSITEVLNWPNPFSTATHFVFTLTGSELPTFMKIQILTVTGKVVREIDMSELGPIRIGRNITQYAWDGTDQFGDRLANGVYLYRVITNIDGKQIEQNQTSASRYFHNGFGKMYLIR